MRLTPMRTALPLACALFLWSAFAGCEGAAEPSRVTLPLRADASGLSPAESDLGYAVEITEAKLSVADFTFATPGELHTRWLRLTSIARAHPGHYEGGSVIGELRGRFVVDFMASEGTLGTATMLVGTYASANFRFETAEDDAAPPLAGHTALLRGRASRDDASVTFTFVVDAPAMRELVGAPFEATLTETSGGALGFRLLSYDPRSDATLFDGIDFFALDADEAGEIIVDPTSEGAASEAYFELRRRLLAHDFYDVRHLPEE